MTRLQKTTQTRSLPRTDSSFPMGADVREGTQSREDFNFSPRLALAEKLATLLITASVLLLLLSCLPLG